MASCLGALTAALCFVGLAVAASLDSQALGLVYKEFMGVFMRASWGLEKEGCSAGRGQGLREHRLLLALRLGR